MVSSAPETKLAKLNVKVKSQITYVGRKAFMNDAYGERGLIPPLPLLSGYQNHNT